MIIVPSLISRRPGHKLSYNDRPMSFTQRLATIITATTKMVRMAYLILRYLRTQTSHLKFPRASRMAAASIAFSFILILLYSNPSLQKLPASIVAQHVIPQTLGTYRIPKGPLPSVNLVVAATSYEDYSWTKTLKIPGMVVVPYIADNTSAEHHAKVNKGHEAMMYHQYFYDFYEELPEISILIHSQAQSWHVDGLLDQRYVLLSTIQILNFRSSRIECKDLARNEVNEFEGIC